MESAVVRVCRACGEAMKSAPFAARERLFGTGEAFDYVECETCGSVQLAEVPPDMQRYYPPAYRPQVRVPGRLGRWLRRQRWAALSGSRWNLAGRVLLARYGRPEWADWMIFTGARPESRILDVGSSDGELLVTLAAVGFRDLTGIDPFVIADREYGPGVRVLRRSLEMQSGPYDLVMFHHSLEHMADPRSALEHARRMLEPGGWVIARVPVAGNYGWRTYREHWAGLEPPRHIVVPSVEGMRRLASAAGLDIVATAYDGKGGYYGLSEAARAGQRLAGSRQSLPRSVAGVYGKQAADHYRALAAQRNRAGDGDTAVFYLRRLPVSFPPSAATR